MEVYFDNSATTCCYEAVKDIVVKTMQRKPYYYNSSGACGGKPAGSFSERAGLRGDSTSCG